MNGKLLFLDIDGTLTEPGRNTPLQSALEAIRKAQANGHKVFLCSGRNLAMLKPLLQYGFDGYVASAGGYVVSGDDVVFDRPMKPEVFRLAMDCFERNHVFRTVECLDGTYGDSGLGDLLEGADVIKDKDSINIEWLPVIIGMAVSAVVRLVSIVVSGLCIDPCGVVAF